MILRAFIGGSGGAGTLAVTWVIYWLAAGFNIFFFVILFRTINMAKANTDSRG
jgi:hypothetical protein